MFAYGLLPYYYFYLGIGLMIQIRIIFVRLLLKIQYTIIFNLFTNVPT